MLYTFLEKYISNLKINFGNQIPCTIFLMFSGFVTFPYTQKTMDLLVTYVVNQACAFKRLPIISKYHHPILMFHNEINFFPTWTFSHWFYFLKRLTPSQIQWHSRWLKITEVHPIGGVDEPPPLVGLIGLMSYYPSKVLCQYCVLQTIPPIPKQGSYHLDYCKEVIMGNQSDNVVKAILDAIGVWYKPPTLWIDVIDEFGLEGEMKDYHAKMEYFHCQVELELEVELPNIPEPQQPQLMQCVKEDQTLANEEHLTHDNKCPRVISSS
ncbi:hypothetical protein BT93_B3043 [Corymbia citriodora subsp. variegata]|nr:hypothetical protein BT93_B3043 [Corymbia citriodora subsp. variegata]